MTKLGDILDTKMLEELIHDGYVSRRFHPEFPELAILNYTEKTAWERIWTRETRATRGLIYNTETSEVLARPFAKFFNYGQDAASFSYDLDAPILGAWDKMDGSLGILYRRPDGVNAIATRGSFESEQAIHATAWIQERWYNENWRNYTPLFEIIYPDNRIVLDYAGRDELVYLGKVHISDGSYAPPVPRSHYDEVWGYNAQAPRISAATLREALTLPARENAEGMVIWLDPYTAVKIKQDDYVALHKIVTGLNRKEVWRQLRDRTFNEWAKALPDEFYNWAAGVASALTDEFYTVANAAQDAFEAVEAEFPAPITRDERKGFALAVKDLPNKSYLFKMLDGGDISPMIWASIEPKGNES